MGNWFTLQPTNFHWEYTEEPHRSRRIEILNKYPEIKKFMKAEGDRRVVFEGLSLLIVQYALAILNCHLPYMPLKIFLNCFIGCWVTTGLMLHGHEAAHGLVFGPGHVWKNRLYGFCMNLGVGMPFYSLFRKLHKKHHRHIGDEVLDAEYPTEFEAQFFPHNPLGKFLYYLAQPFLFCVRTPAVILKRPYWWWDLEEMINSLAIAALFLAISCTEYAQIFGHMSLALLAATSSNLFGYWGMVSHIEFFPMKETTSYYGWLNRFYLNFGYHMEHHDFPNIPSRYLPEVHKIAPEYYEDVFCFDSYHSAIVKFTFDRKLGVFSRLKRANTKWNYKVDENENYRKFTK